MTTEFVSQLESLHTDAFGWALHCCCGDFDLAEEVLQLAYSKLLDGRACFAGDSALKTWWFGVLRFTALEELRRLRFRRSLLGRLLQFGADDTEDVASPRENVERSEQATKLQAMLAKLPPRQAEVLHLVFFQDMTIAEASVLMKISVGSARQHYERAKAGLRTLIQTELEVPNEVS